MNFISISQARNKDLRTFANHLLDSKPLSYDEVFEKGQDMPFNCQRADLCPEIANQPWSPGHSTIFQKNS